MQRCALRICVAGILWARLPGQEGGMAVADVLLGRVEPGGRLPMSLPAHPGQVPVLDTNPVEGVIDYALAPLSGYQAMTRPAYRFGHGLGFTTWSYDTLRVTAGDGVEVVVTVTNTGDRHGKEIVQCYIAPHDTAEDGRLAGFAVVRADPGATTTARIHISARTLARYRDGTWQVPTGPYHLRVGSSALDPRLDAHVMF
ncbi:MAG TPA: hypothetical protein DGT23_06345 [Micromonosporaceae bacterium]|nr:hypothetical protein [Micromonosporaceae bacterium]